MKIRFLQGFALFVLVMGVMLPSMASAQAKGQDTFKAKCAMCHGADGSGNTAMGKSMSLKDLGSSDIQGMSDGDLTNVITNGKGKMPGYKGKLSDAQIADLVSYIRTMKK